MSLTQVNHTFLSLFFLLLCEKKGTINSKPQSVIILKPFLSWTSHLDLPEQLRWQCGSDAQLLLLCPGRTDLYNSVTVMYSSKYSEKT